jgi:hypothetical protein
LRLTFSKAYSIPSLVLSFHVITLSTIIYGTDAYNKIKEKQIEASHEDNEEED